MTSFNAHKLKMQRQIARDWQTWTASAPAAPEVTPAPAAPEFKPGDRVVYRMFNPLSQISRDLPGVVVNITGYVLVALDNGGHAWANPQSITLEQT